MGLPKININFFGKMKEAMKRDAAGVVALILRDDTQSDDSFIYKRDSKPEGWSDKNLGYIEQAFLGGPREVIVVRVDNETESYAEALNRLKNKRFNYLAIPEIQESETEEVATWIKSKRKDDRKSFKVVLPNTKGNHESIINFTAKDLVTKTGEEYNTADYTARIAGILAGLPFNRSSTYYILGELESVFEIDNPDEAVDNGELILINDGENIKIGRGVNSLTTIEPNDNKNNDFKSIRVVEIMDMIHDEIRDNYVNRYVGKVPNIYDNQVLFLADVNRGLDELAGLELLDPNNENRAWVDVDAQRQAWVDMGTDTSDWDDQRVKETSFKRHLFLAGKIKIVDTMEDLEFNIEI